MQDGLSLRPCLIQASKGMLYDLLLVGIGVYLFAGLVKGTLGIGLPTTAVSLMAVLVDARTAVALVIIPMVVLNAWQIYRQRMLMETVREFWIFSVVLSLSIFCTSMVATNISIKVVTYMLGFIVAIFSFGSLLKQVPELPQRYDKLAQVIAGAVSGIIGGVAGLWSPPMVMYLSSKRLSSERFVGIVGLFLFFGSLFLLFGYVYNGTLTPKIAATSFVLLPIALVGFYFGEKFRRRIDAKRFERYLLIFFFIAGCNLIFRAWRM